MSRCVSPDLPTRPRDRVRDERPSETFLLDDVLHTRPDRLLDVDGGLRGPPYHLKATWEWESKKKFKMDCQEVFDPVLLDLLHSPRTGPCPRDIVQTPIFFNQTHHLNEERRPVDSRLIVPGPSVVFLEPLPSLVDRISVSRPDPKPLSPRTGH